MFVKRNKKYPLKKRGICTLLGTIILGIGFYFTLLVSFRLKINEELINGKSATTYLNQVVNSSVEQSGWQLIYSGQDIDSPLRILWGQYLPNYGNNYRITFTKGVPRKETGIWVLSRVKNWITGQWYYLSNDFSDQYEELKSQREDYYTQEKWKHQVSYSIDIYKMDDSYARDELCKVWGIDFCTATKGWVIGQTSWTGERQLLDLQVESL